MNTATTAFARPPERRRCGRSFRAHRPAHARPVSAQPPDCPIVAPSEPSHPPGIHIDFSTAPPCSTKSQSKPDRSAKGGIA